MAHIKQQTSRAIPCRLVHLETNNRQHRSHSKHFIRASKYNSSPTKPRPTQQTSMKKGDGFKVMDLSNSPGPFLSTCCRYLLQWDFSTETLVCVSSRDTDFTYCSLSVYAPPQMTWLWISDVHDTHLASYTHFATELLAPF